MIISDEEARKNRQKNAMTNMLESIAQTKIRLANERIARIKSYISMSLGIPLDSIDTNGYFYQFFYKGMRFDLGDQKTRIVGSSHVVLPGDAETELIVLQGRMWSTEDKFLIDSYDDLDMMAEWRTYCHDGVAPQTMVAIALSPDTCCQAHEDRRLRRVEEKKYPLYNRQKVVVKVTTKKNRKVKNKLLTLTKGLIRLVYEKFTELYKRHNERSY